MCSDVLPWAVFRAVLCTVVLSVLCRDVQAQRPFDGTDAAVVGKGKFELEAGIGGRRGVGVDSIATPSTTGSYGLSADTEVAFGAELQHHLAASASGERNSLAETELMAKHVYLHGELQDSPGPSVAVQCAILLPELNGANRFGEACTAIASIRWKGVTSHVNLGLARLRDHTAARTANLMLEGSSAWALAPVAELVAESDHGGNQLRSALIGMVYRRSTRLSLDVGVRHARATTGDFNEVRLGISLEFDTGE